MTEDSTTVLAYLAEHPTGLTMDELADLTHWSHYRVNAALCAAGNQVHHDRRREGRRQVTRYFLKQKENARADV